MPKAEEIQVIVELTHHTLHALRAANGTIEAGGECVLENKAALEALLGAVVPSAKADGLKVASLWPDGAEWHVSTETESLLDRTSESLRTIAGSTQGDAKHPFSYAACNAGDGGLIDPDGMDKWILAFASRESVERVCGGIPGLKVESAGAGPAAIARAGAISASLRTAGKGSVALWDLGSDRSHLLLVTAGGIEGVVPCAVGLNTVFEAVRTVLRFKFRGAGERLFFNEGYDFTETGPKICAVVGEGLKVALGLLPQAEGPPALACIGLTGRQSWFIRNIAAAVGASPWAPDLRRHVGDLGLRFAGDAVESSFSAASAGVLALLGSRLASRDAWNPAWIEAEAPAQEVLVEPAPEAPEPAAQPVTAPSRSKPTLAPSGTAVPPPVSPKLTAPTALKKAAMPAPPAPPPIPRPVPPFPIVRQPAPPSFSPAAFAPPPEPAATELGTVARPPPIQLPFASGAHKSAAADAPLSKPVVVGVPVEPEKPGPVLPAQGAPAAREEPQPRSKVGFYVGVFAAAALVFAAIAIVLDYRMERIKEKDLEQQEALAHHLAEVRIKGTEQSRREEAERTRKDVETAIGVTQTENTARQTVPVGVETTRPSRLPGTLVVATDPAGASVSIDGAAALISPVKAQGIAPGAHRVRIALADHEPVELNAEVEGSRTTDLGTVRLESSLGALEVSSSPDGLDFSVRPAADPTGNPVKSGRTPATIADVPRGDYVVTFTRPGCHDHAERVTVEKGAKTPVETKYVDGSLELTSDPTGAWVEKDGMRLGSTPLVLHDLTPKVASFELTLPGYDPTPISCEIPEGQTLKLTAHLLRSDRVFSPSEAKTLPVSYESPEPELSPSQRMTGAEVLLSFVVLRDGTVINVKVEKTTDDDIGRRCATAVANWKFHPGTAADDRAVDVRIEMQFKFPAAKQ
jgi:TonB family protein